MTNVIFATLFTPIERDTIVLKDYRTDLVNTSHYNIQKCAVHLLTAYTFLIENKVYRMASRFKNVFTKCKHIVTLVSNQQLEQLTFLE